MTPLYFGRIKRLFTLLLVIAASLFLAGCENSRMVIITGVDEREANEIVVFLASRNIASDKMAATSVGPAGGDTTPKFSISVSDTQATEAMAILNQNGLPRKKGTNLLDLFGKSGLMSSDKEETIRYQAGLASQIGNMIRKIDGVIDADVQLSFPAAEATASAAGFGGGGAPKKITAAVYVKHQGILDDPNSHLVTKIKRLVAGSVAGLDVNDVTVISDRSRFTDVSLNPMMEPLDGKGKQYVSIWSIVMNKDSAARFRFLFFLLSLAAIVFALAMGWLIWKFYPILKRRGGFKALLHPIPLEDKDAKEAIHPEGEEKQ